MNDKIELAKSGIDTFKDKLMQEIYKLTSKISETDQKIMDYI
jgi:hypothetical protein